MKRTAAQLAREIRDTRLLLGLTEQMWAAYPRTKRHKDRIVILYQRRTRLRRQARLIHLARAFLKGTPYCKCEKPIKGYNLILLDIVDILMRNEPGLDQREVTFEVANWIKKNPIQ